MSDLLIRTDIRPGDIGAIVQLHGTTYAREYGFDATFEAYVAGPLAECVLRVSTRDRVFMTELDGRLAGCAAIVGSDAPTRAQLRWFLVAPFARRRGLGRRLLHEAIRFAVGAGYSSIFLWTVSALSQAAQLYEEAGFAKVEDKPGHRWGVDVVEQRYELDL